MPKLTTGIIMAWNLAMFETHQANYEEITPELFLCGITKLEDARSPEFLREINLPNTLQDTYLQETEIVLNVFRDLGIIPRSIRHTLRNSIGDGGFKRGEKTESPIHRSIATKEIFARALLAAENNGLEFADLPHILVSILEYQNKIINQILTQNGVNITELITAFQRSSLPVNETLSPEEARRLIDESDEDDTPEVTVTVKLPTGETKSIHLNQSEIIIGRRGGSQPVDVDLYPDQAVSRQHAKLFYERRCWYIVDLGSAYGTLVDGQKASKACLLTLQSRIQIGNSHITIGYESIDTQIIDVDEPSVTTGTITNFEAIDELAPPSSMSEDGRISVLAEIMQVAASAQSNGELLEGCIQMIRTAIPHAERVTILTGQDNELFPAKYYPREQAYYSSTFVNKARDSKVAFSWVSQDDQGQKTPESVFNAVAAMYSPMIRNKLVVGVLHVDSKSLFEGFSKAELDTLSVIGNVIALALKPSKNEEIIPSVFISYAHKDASMVNKLKEDLRRNGISVWIDERLKVANDAWQKQLALAIQNQKFFLFVVTPSSVSSKYCEWELHTALSLQKPIIPIMIEKADIPITITTLQYIEFLQDYKKALSKLVQSLQ